jgi:hypothetical protein
MSKESSKAKVEKKKKQTRNTATAKGLYTKTRSKWIKEPDTSYGAVVTLAREKAMDKNGGPLPKGTAVHHTKGSKEGAKNTEDDNHFAVVSFGDNVRESNMRRAGRTKAYIRKKLGKEM